MIKVAHLGAALSKRYVLERELGRGGMGTVYLAFDNKFGRNVAIKVLHPELTHSVGATRFLQEIQTASRLSHPHILSVFDSGEADGLLYYIMPYVAGESLRELLNKHGHLPVPVAIRIAVGVLGGLEHAHAKDVLHRDIKPENILLSDGYFPLIADFGVARALSLARDVRLTATGLSVGSPIYSSPEQAIGEAVLYPQSDLYSVGCLLYEMLCGKPPYSGPTVQSVIHQHHTAPPPSVCVANAGVPTAIDEVIRTAMAKQISDRFASAADFTRAIIAAEPSAGQYANASQLQWSWRAFFSRRAVVATAAVAGIAALGYVAWTAWPPGPPGGFTELERPRIAVLYFEDGTPQNDLGYLADGITETLIQELSQLQDIQVISENGVRQFRNASVSTDSISSVLSAQLIIGGRVFRAGDKLRVNVSVTNAETGANMLGRIFERPWGDEFTLLDQLVVDVSEFLRKELGREVQIRRWRSETKNVNAWRLMLRAEEMSKRADKLELSGMMAGLDPLLKQADSLLARAQELDPNWMQPLVQRADLHQRRGIVAALLNKLEVARQEFVDGLLLADEAVIKAGDAAAYEVRANLRYWQLNLVPSPDAQVQETALRAVEHDLRRAVVLDADRAEAWGRLASVLNDKAKFTEARDAAQKALNEDAYLRGADESTYLLFATSFELGDDDAARRWCAQVQRRFMNPWPALTCRFQLMAWSPTDTMSSATAWKLLAQIPRSEESQSRLMYAQHTMLIAAALVREGLADSARATLSRAVKQNPMPEATQDWEAAVRLKLGQRDDASRLIKSYLGTRPHDRPRIENSRLFRGIPQNRSTATG